MLAPLDKYSCVESAYFWLVMQLERVVLRTLQPYSSGRPRNPSYAAATAIPSSKVVVINVFVNVYYYVPEP